MMSVSISLKGMKPELEGDNLTFWVNTGSIGPVFHPSFYDFLSDSGLDSEEQKHVENAVIKKIQGIVIAKTLTDRMTVA